MMTSSNGLGSVLGSGLMRYPGTLYGVREVLIASPETVKKASGIAEPAGADATP
jgi:hypothetical protein